MPIWVVLVHYDKSFWEDYEAEYDDYYDYDYDYDDDDDDDYYDYDYDLEWEYHKVEEYGNDGYPVIPFKIKVTSDIPYYNGPGENHKINGYTGKGVFTIVEIKNDFGKLKSGSGWVKLY